MGVASNKWAMGTGSPGKTTAVSLAIHPWSLMRLAQAIFALQMCLAAQVPEQAHLDQLARFPGNKLLE